jgi:cyclic pyranopterin phosphate synthase
MPTEGIRFKTHDAILTFEEIVRVVSILAGMGIRKIRVTGGEPLVRRGLVDLITSLNNIDGIEEISITTNGILLHQYAHDLNEAGIGRINVSLDTLRQDRFARITGRNLFDRVLKGIEQAKKCGMYPIKINTVIMKGINDDEIIDFIGFALSKKLTLRFIEFMKITPLWNSEYFLPVEQIIERCKETFDLVEITPTDPSPARYYKTDTGGLIGFIKTDSRNCRMCTRLRLLSTGQLKICLYEWDGLSLREQLRGGSTDDTIRDAINERIDIKEGCTYSDWSHSQSYMCSLGG